MAWTDPLTWVEVYVSLFVSLVPVGVFLVYGMKHRKSDSADDWYNEEPTGPHRIASSVHLVWLSVACSLSGIAQFLAISTDEGKWYYGAAMLLFLVSTLMQCCWVVSYFKMMGMFRVARLIIFTLVCINIVLLVFYAGVDVVSSVLLSLRVAFHDVPMLYINHVAVKRNSTSMELGKHDEEVHMSGMVSVAVEEGGSNCYDSGSDADMPVGDLHNVVLSEVDDAELARLGIAVRR